MSIFTSRQISKACGDTLNTVPKPGEEDMREPPCTVYLYTRPVIVDQGKSAKVAKHWILYFEWSHYSATYEAVNLEGILTPNSHPGKPHAPENMTFEIREIKKDLRVSAKTVDEKVKENTLNGKVFEIITASCQIWAKELGRLLGFEVPTGQVEKIADIGLTGTLLAVGAAATGALIAGSGKSKEST